MSAPERTGLRRYPTGVPPLDEMLGGGLPAYAVVILAGEPGTGKTILSQQILFAGAAEGRRGLYVTTLSESPLKIARYQSEFAFFDPDKFGDAVVYMDIGEIIRREDPSHAVEAVADTLREHQPELVVVDSFKAIHDLAPSLREMRTFAYDLAVELAAIQATTLLVGEYEQADIGRMPEFAVADGIIWLTLERSKAVAQRFLRILKMRGVDIPTGAFGFDISRDGVSVFAVPPLAPSPVAAGFTPTGVSGLDEVMRGGIPTGTSLLVSGEAGTGKTTLGLQFVFRAAAEPGERGAYFSYEQPPEQLIASARTFGWDVRPLVERGQLTFHHTPLPRVNADREIIRIRDMVARTGATRVVVDSLTMLMHGIDEPDVVRRHVYNLVTILGAAGCTALINTDPPAGSGLISRFGVEESLVDGVLVLRMVKDRQERKRYAEIYKLRGANHASGDSLMRIGADGIRVFPRAEEATR
jgi:circadian clock protein KaiC